MQRIDQALFDQVAQEAEQSPRRRRNHNLHKEADLVQRFVNVLQPGTYVRPHRHLREIAGTGFECFVVLQGAIGLILFDGEGEACRWEKLEATGPLRGIELEEVTYHSLVALSRDAVMLEIKQGPYNPSTDKDFLARYPAEGTAEAQDLVAKWASLFA
jgi:cupin fold WbuC family metalloprotein